MKVLFKASAVLALFLPLLSGRCLASPAPNLSRGNQWLGIGSAAFVGFGLGQGVEGRYQKMGWPFTLADGVAWGMILSSFGDCAPGSSCSSPRALHNAGLGLLAASRVAQIGELLLFGANHGLFQEESRSYRKRSASFNLIPIQNGQGLAGVAALHF